MNALSHFCVVVHSKWKIICNTEARHETKDVKDLSYDVITPTGFDREFIPNSQALYVLKVNPKNKGRTLGANSGYSKSVFGISCHAVMGSDGSEVEDISIETVDGTMVTGLTDDKANDDSNREDVATVEGSTSNFSKGIRFLAIESED